jgi:hypothetical protein
MLQGENLPSQVSQLEAALQGHRDLLNLYLLGLTAVMCGLSGVATLTGSLFMDETNGCTMTMALRALLQLGSWTPNQVYWTYIISRAEHLGMAVDTHDEHQVALCRLVCLLRVTGADDLTKLQKAWSLLESQDRDLVAANLLSDGITNRAFMFLYLPLYFANARKNPAVGMHQSLAIFVEVLDALAGTHIEHGLEMTTTVDLSDLAQFTNEVRVHHIFAVCVAYLKIVPVRQGEGGSMRVIMTAQNWSRVTSSGVGADTRTLDVVQMVRRLAKHQAEMQARLDGFINRDSVAVSPAAIAIRLLKERGRLNKVPGIGWQAKDVASLDNELAI